VVAIVIITSLLISCTKTSEYKRKKSGTTGTPPPTLPTTPSLPPATNPTGYLTLPKADARFIYQQAGVVIENLRFENIQGIALYIKSSSNITVRNCFFNKATNEAINIESSANITIENCLFNGVESGVYVMGSETIKVSGNQFVNVRKRADESRGQFVQFNKVTGTGNMIENNKGENFSDESNPEDLISLYKSSGTAASPVSIRNNMFRGGGPSASGGGIMTGDNGGDFIIVENNTLVDPGQYGIATSGGSNITIINNKMFAKKQSFSNNPLYVWGQSAACSDIIVRNNRANWTDMNDYISMGWYYGNCSNTLFEYATPITLEEMNVPAHLITMITPEELVQIRN
jgi:parallel beta-helix repeat protein